MSVFYYRVKDGNGQIREGEIEAAERDEAATLLRTQHLHIIRLTAVPRTLRWLNKSDSPNDSRYMALFCRRLALLADTRSLHESLKLMAAQETASQTAEQLHVLCRSVESGHSLGESMLKQPQRFPARVAHFVKVGEQSGNLPTVLEKLADYLEQEATARQKFGAAMLYPALLSVATLAALLIMAVFILPSLTVMFADLDAELPWPTRLLLNVSEFITADGFYLSGGLCLGAVLLVYLNRQDKFGRRWDRQKLNLPIFGELWLNVAWLHILSALAVMQSGGLRMTESLTLAQDIPDNRYLRQILIEAERKVEHGSTLKAALEGADVPPMILQLIEVGEETGRLEEMLGKSAAYVKITAEDKLNRIQALTEPVLVLAVGAFVVMLVLAVVWPILDMVDGIM